MILSTVGILIFVHFMLLSTVGILIFVNFMSRNPPHKLVIICQKGNSSKMVLYYAFLLYIEINLRNKSWKPECVGSFNTDWRISVF
jgi:hypothetical protein